MGKIICSEKRLVNKLESMRLSSKLLDKTLDDILKLGDINIHILKEDHSCYDNRHIILGLNQLPQSQDIESTLIIELCNAWFDSRGGKPRQDDYDNAEDYAVAVERQEWEAVKKHIEILDELNFTKDSLGPSRFKQAFEDPEYNWNVFDNYLAFQQKTNHTKQIQSHWKSSGSEKQKGATH